MDSFVRYYIHEVDRGKNNGKVPAYAAPFLIQRGYGIGCFCAGLFRAVRHVLWSCANKLGTEAIS